MIQSELMDEIERLTKASTVEHLFQLFEKSMTNRGFDRILLALMNDHTALKLSAQHGILKNYPDDWLIRYIEQGYEKIDPVNVNVTTQLVPFTWDELQLSPIITSKQIRMFKEAEAAGLHCGIGIPLYGPRGANAGFGLASTEKDVDLNFELLTTVHILATQFYACYWRLNEKPEVYARRQSPSLSTKELDVLKCLAEGLTKTETSRILNISAHTVDYHTRIILNKLGAKNAVSAVYFALSYGLLPFA